MSVHNILPKTLCIDEIPNRIIKAKVTYLKGVFSLPFVCLEELEKSKHPDVIKRKVFETITACGDIRVMVARILDMAKDLAELEEIPTDLFKKSENELMMLSQKIEITVAKNLLGLLVRHSG